MFLFFLYAIEILRVGVYSFKKLENTYPMKSVKKKIVGYEVKSLKECKD